jgi:NTP pyrophosphatase (non-canonical NTP hydrolase)
MKESDSLEKLLKLVKEFVLERDWQEAHNPKNLSASIAIESAELMEIFQWMTVEESKRISDVNTVEHIAEELADVLIYCFSFANQYDFDLNEIIEDKIKKNSLKYPLDREREE